MFIDNAAVSTNATISADIQVAAVEYGVRPLGGKFMGGKFADPGGKFIQATAYSIGTPSTPDNNIATSKCTMQSQDWPPPALPAGRPPGHCGDLARHLAHPAKKSAAAAPLAAQTPLTPPQALDRQTDCAAASGWKRAQRRDEFSSGARAI
ncbi:hypothetical protein Dda_0330 [Drechslerella dactyloides]|uniref:Uncharacterized protein n=1 Tax=Drechslerella dactyloides TaxID=74499 RepID=A0AAD6NMZ6_DREDA|nr:hypothetical protein Dda_0330 [Drechslerella dactyloides]